LIVHDVGLVHHDHGTEHLLQGIVIDRLLIFLVNNVSFLVHDTEALDFIVRAAEFHVIGKFVLEHFHVHSVHGSEGALS
jgi:hypothetical protein